MPFLRKVRAVEIISPTGQGYTQPFFIKADDGEIYVVKGMAGAGAAGLVSEFICAELGNRYGLPMPEHALMYIPKEMLDFSLIDGIENLYGKVAFASKRITHARTLNFSQIDLVSQELQQKIYMFDVWVSNDDRNLSREGGNVNLLIDDENNIYVIDHNLAFSKSDHASPREHHVFRNQLNSLDDYATRDNHLSAMCESLENWDRIVEKIPEEWIYKEPFGDDEYEPTLESRYELLLKAHDDAAIWREA